MRKYGVYEREVLRELRGCEESRTRERTADMKRHSPRSQGQTVPESVPERETPAFITPKPPEKGLLRALTSLRQRNFRLFWFGQMISLMGTSMQIIGQAWLVLVLTHSAWQLGLVGALQSLPVLLFSIFGGVFADRSLFLAQSLQESGFECFSEGSLKRSNS